MTLTPPPRHDRLLELHDLRCPNLLFATVRAVADLAPGQVVRIEAGDLSAPSNLTAWARQSGNEILELFEDGGIFVIYLRRGQAPERPIPTDPAPEKGSDAYGSSPTAPA